MALGDGDAMGRKVGIVWVVEDVGEEKMIVPLTVGWDGSSRL